MEVNAIIMTPEMLSALKDEIIAEVRKEQGTQQTSRYELSTAIRKETQPIFGNDNQLQNAFSTIARKTFGIRHQTFFYGESLDKATQMIKELAAVVQKYRKDDNHEQTSNH